MIKKHLILFFVLCVLAIAIYWPKANSEFVLDDYYTVVHNPLIKQPDLYPKIWQSRLFDAHKSSAYVKLLYYRPVLESSFIVDYNLFGLNPLGYKWVNVMIHLLNAVLIYILCLLLFYAYPLAFKTSVLFLIFPLHEWVVRYVTGRGDSLQTFFGLAFLIFLVKGFKGPFKRWYFYAAICLVLSALTREFGYLMPLYGLLVFYTYTLILKPVRVALFWIMIGCLSFAVSYQIIPKLGSIQALHLFYFISIGVCLLLAHARTRFIIILCAALSIVSFEQGLYWQQEEILLRHTQRHEIGTYTAASQQILMKYDQNIPAIEGVLMLEKDPIIKSMWLNRLGSIYRSQGQEQKAIQSFQSALEKNPKNVDALNALAVVYLEKGNADKGIELLKNSLSLDSQYSETLKLCGIYFYRQHDVEHAKQFLSQALFYDPDNSQVKELLALTMK